MLSLFSIYNTYFYIWHFIKPGKIQHLKNKFSFPFQPYDSLFHKNFLRLWIWSLKCNNNKIIKLKKENKKEYNNTRKNFPLRQC